ncbi:MAG: PCRF domain-containing protein, partial [Candidatus Stygibacter australis]|nr:PCRF domain-containing protein [Candidatus Stygibacter australis]
MIPEEKLSNLRNEMSELEKDVYDPAKMSDKRAYSKISRRYKELQEILRVVDEYEKLQSTIDENQQLIETEEDKELHEMAEEENARLEEELEVVHENLKELLIPLDPNDHKDVLVEIRAGTGGDEAALFCADLFRMYTYFGEKMGWKQTVISSNPIGVGGFKEI